jgi:hypothetical protein
LYRLTISATKLKIPSHKLPRKKINGQIGKDGNLVLGFSLPFWQSVFFWATVIAAIASGIGVTAAFVSAMVGYQISDMVQSEADQRIADAHERASALEKEAADARLETERLKQVVAWRFISPETASKLKEILAAKPGNVNLRYIDGDPEALFLAIQFSKILTDSNWQVAPGSRKVNAIIFGIILPDPSSHEMKVLRDAFSAAKIVFSTVLFISIDSQRDTSAHLKEYLSSFDPRIHGLTGTGEQIAAVARNIAFTTSASRSQKAATRWTTQR